MSPGIWSSSSFLFSFLLFFQGKAYYYYFFFLYKGGQKKESKTILSPNCSFVLITGRKSAFYHVDGAGRSLTSDANSAFGA